MSIYQELKQQLEDCRCPDCWGKGTQNDAEPGDTWFDTWECPTCKGSGIHPDKAISLDIEG